MDVDDLHQVELSLRQAVRAAPGAAREAIVEFGWRELLADDPHAAVSVLFGLQGELLLPGTFLDDVLIAAAGLSELPTDIRVVLPPLGAVHPASRLAPGGTVTVDGVVQAGSGPVLIVALDSADQVSFVLSHADAVVPPQHQPIDPAAGWLQLQSVLPVERVLDELDATLAWQQLVAAGRRALAHELVATSAAMLDLTVDHVKTREQFGRPLGTFQAVKHQLADVYLWLEVARLSAQAAWEDSSEESAALANAAALRSSRSARAVCQQLLGGMGFTWEHDFHFYLRRAITLEPLLGDAPTLHAELGTALRSGSIPDSLVSL